MLKQQLGKSSCTDWRTYYCAYTNALGYSSARSVHYLWTYYVAHGKIDDMMGVTTTTIHKTRAVGAWGPGEEAIPPPQILTDHFTLYFQRNVKEWNIILMINRCPNYIYVFDFFEIAGNFQPILGSIIPLNYYFIPIHGCAKSG